MSWRAGNDGNQQLQAMQTPVICRAYLIMLSQSASFSLSQPYPTNVMINITATVLATQPRKIATKQSAILTTTT